MKEICCYVDESGSYGRFTRHSPYYLVTFVLHDPANSLSEKMRRLDDAMQPFGLLNHAIHTAPLIRREGDYINLPTVTRKQIFNRLFYFARSAAFTYQTIIVDKRQLQTQEQLNDWLTKRLKLFLSAHLESFLAYDKVVVFYDNGQMELTDVLSAGFCGALNTVEFRKILPVNHRLAQVADLICTLELLALKAERKELSNSEIAFFNSARELQRHYIDHIRKKRI
jgi:hypothetical protein